MLVVRVLALSLVVLIPAVAQKPRPAARKPAAAKQQQAPAPAVVDPSKPFTLSRIEVTGNKNFTAEQVIALSGLKPGQNVRKADFDEAQQKLLDSGLFETVAYRYEPVGRTQEYSARFEVKEIEQIYPYRFESLAGDEKAMRAWLKEKEPQFGDRIPPTMPVVRRFATALTDYFKKNGHDVEVSGRVLPNEKGQLEVVFQPSSLPAVAEVKFKGNSIITETTLQQAIAGTAVGAIYTEKGFRQILDHAVRPLYEAQGRLKVTFPKIETEPAQGVKGLVATVTVAEGEPYKLTNVRITGPLADDKSLTKIADFQLNATVNMKAVEESTDKIEKALKRRGYLSARSVVDRKLNDADKTVQLSVEVDPGPQYKMGQLTIEGLDIETEPHIRKMWALKPNQPFNVDYPDTFLAEMPNVLDNLGKTRAAVNPDPGTLKVDVVLIFTPPEKKAKKPAI
jgi:outer membrane protein insertion porin family